MLYAVTSEWRTHNTRDVNDKNDGKEVIIGPYEFFPWLCGIAIQINRTGSNDPVLQTGKES